MRGRIIVKEQKTPFGAHGLCLSSLTLSRSLIAFTFEHLVRASASTSFLSDAAPAIVARVIGRHGRCLVLLDARANAGDWKQADVRFPRRWPCRRRAGLFAFRHFLYRRPPFAFSNGRVLVVGHCSTARSPSRPDAPRSVSTRQANVTAASKSGVTTAKQEAARQQTASSAGKSFALFFYPCLSFSREQRTHPSLGPGICVQTWGGETPNSELLKK